MDPGRRRGPLLQLSADRSGHEDFGLLLAGRRRLSTLGPLSVVLSQEPDLRSALRLLTGYERSYNEALRLRLDEGGGLATIRLWLEFGEPVPVRQSLELATAALHGIIRELLGRQLGAAVGVLLPPRSRRRSTPTTRCSGRGCSSTTRSPGWSSTPTSSTPPNTMSDPLLRPYAQQFLGARCPPRAARR